ncbi:Hypothetical_protein [Hexamita inflata]|uniref:Hypothetical_protein n=1 Tax=Hexamita inflata TaxID=28002 RepID=A0AA86N435_9EUKA|nr:Hypothetical protein HINF_LOCUS292 [Hexamita inflata]
MSDASFFLLILRIPNLRFFHTLLVSFSYISTRIFTHTLFIRFTTSIFSLRGGRDQAARTSRVVRPGRASRRRLAGPVDPGVAVVCIQEHPNPTLQLILVNFLSDFLVWVDKSEEGG